MEDWLGYGWNHHVIKLQAEHMILIHTGSR